MYVCMYVRVSLRMFVLHQQLEHAVSTAVWTAKPLRKNSEHTQGELG